MDEVKIEYLPTIGEAYSHKSRSQGRSVTLSEIENERLLVKKVKIEPNGKVITTISRRSYRRVKASVMRANARRIIASTRATDKQKKIAYDFLSSQQGTQEYKFLFALLNRINRTMHRQNKL